MDPCENLAWLTFLFSFPSGFISQAAKLGTQGSPTCRLFSLEELKEATNNFDPMTFLGEGSIGKVSLGNLNMLCNRN